MKRIIKSILFLLIIMFVNNGEIVTVHAQTDDSNITYKIAEFAWNTTTSGDCIVTIDQETYQLSDDAVEELEEVTDKVVNSSNKNVVYKMNGQIIEHIYTMDQVLYPTITVDINDRDGLIYQNGKFNEKSNPPAMLGRIV